MKKPLLFSITLVFLIACGGVKNTQEAINNGNYYTAMNKAIDNLADNKTKKRHQPYIVLLEEAFKKNTERELQNIKFLKKDGNPANLEAIYTSFTNLRRMQRRIRPLLPLRIVEEGRDATFLFTNYDERIIASKNELSEYLYANASNLMENALNKSDYKNAYSDFNYLNKINPGYRDTRLKIEEAHAKGMDYVKVDIINETEQIIPVRLEEELLNFNTYGLNNLWTEYHSNAVDSLNYDYEMQVAFRNIAISPEQVRETQIVKERQIKDGYSYATNDDGAIVRDSLGNKIKIDKFRTVSCDFYQFTQFKSTQVTGNVVFMDLRTNQQLNAYPLSSEFVFEHVYANYEGDKRALNNDLISLLNLGAVPFPSNEQMVYDAGEDIKSRLKQIIVNQNF